MSNLLEYLKQVNPFGEGMWDPEKEREKLETETMERAYATPGGPSLGPRRVGSGQPQPVPSPPDAPQSTFEDVMTYKPPFGPGAGKSLQDAGEAVLGTSHVAGQTFAGAAVGPGKFTPELGGTIAQAFENMGVKNAVASHEALLQERQQAHDPFIPDFERAEGAGPVAQIAGTLIGYAPYFMTGAGMGAGFLKGAGKASDVGLAAALEGGRDVAFGLMDRGLTPGISGQEPGEFAQGVGLDAAAGATLGTVMHGISARWSRMDDAAKSEILGLMQRDGIDANEAKAVLDSLPLPEGEIKPDLSPTAGGIPVKETPFTPHPSVAVKAPEVRGNFPVKEVPFQPAPEPIKLKKGEPVKVRVDDVESPVPEVTGKVEEKPTQEGFRQFQEGLEKEGKPEVITEKPIAADKPADVPVERRTVDRGVEAAWTEKARAEFKREHGDEALLAQLKKTQAEGKNIRLREDIRKPLHDKKGPLRPWRKDLQPELTAPETAAYQALKSKGYSRTEAQQLIWAGKVRGESRGAGPSLPKRYNHIDVIDTRNKINPDEILPPSMDGTPPPPPPPGGKPSWASGTGSPTARGNMAKAAMDAADRGDFEGAVRIVDDFYGKKKGTKMPSGKHFDQQIGEWMNKMDEGARRSFQETSAWGRRVEKGISRFKSEKGVIYIETDYVPVADEVTNYKSRLRAEQEASKPADQASSAWKTVRARLKEIDDAVGATDVTKRAGEKVYQAMEFARKEMEVNIGKYLAGDISGKHRGIWEILEPFNVRSKKMLGGKFARVTTPRSKSSNAKMRNVLSTGKPSGDPEIDKAAKEVMSLLDRFHRSQKSEHVKVFNRDLFRTLLKENKDPAMALEGYISEINRLSSKFWLDNAQNPIGFKQGIKELRAQMKEANFSPHDKKFIDDLDNALGKHNPVANWMTTAQSTMSISKLPFVALTNLNQVNHTMGRLGVTNGVEAIWKTTMPNWLGGDIRGARKAAFNAGNALDSVLDESLSVLLSGAKNIDTGSGNAHARFQALAKTVVGDYYGLKPMERWLRTQADYAGRKLLNKSFNWMTKEGIGVEELSKALKRLNGDRSFKSFGENIRNSRVAKTAYDLQVLMDNDPAKALRAFQEYKQRGQITELMYINASRGAVKATQYRVGTQDLPIQLAGKSPFMKMIAQFKTFSYKHAEMLAHVGDQAARGNVLPAMKLMTVAFVGAQITGNVVEELKSLVSGKKLPGDSVLSGAVEYVTGTMDQETWHKRLVDAGMAPHKDFRASLERSMHNFMAWGGFGLPYDVTTSLIGEKAFSNMAFGPAFSTAKDFALSTAYLLNSAREQAINKATDKPVDTADVKKRAKDLAGETARLVPVVGGELRARIAYEEPEQKQPGALEHLGILPSLAEARQERKLREEIGEQQKEIGIQRKPGQYVSPADRERSRRERKERAFGRDVDKRKILEAYKQSGEGGALTEYQIQKIIDDMIPKYKGPKVPTMIPPELQEILDRYELRK
jgi:hypothetical protein